MLEQTFVEVQLNARLRTDIDNTRWGKRGGGTQKRWDIQCAIVSKQHSYPVSRICEMVQWEVQTM